MENYSTLHEGRKNVAVIFADVAGFTALSEKMDPEEVREIINECFNYITGPVYELGGTIDKYIGDCVMILFGARYTHTDDARRAVLCAMKMMNLIDEFSRSNLSSKGISLKLSVGINYGLVVTGGVGNYFDRDYTVMGDIVNTAQRLQTCAEEGEILVSESVNLNTLDWFDYSRASQVKVRNRVTPVKCYRPLKIRKEYQYDGEQSFIGRRKETALLNTLYNDSMNTGLQAVVVSGDAGIGKTRLLKEFTSRLGNNVKKVWTDCGSDFVNRPYSMVSGILSSIMNINPPDSISVKQHRLISFLDYILDDRSDEEILRCYNFIGMLMGLDRDKDFQNVLQSMNFDTVRREIIKQLTLFFKSLCTKQNVVIVADGVQWADSNSLELMEELIPGLEPLRTVLIYATRNDRQLPAKNTRQVRLEALNQADTIRLACGLLECDRLEENLLNTVMKLSGGNPLYVSEFIVSLKQKDGFHLEEGTASLDQHVMHEMPTSIRNLMLSSLSSLNPQTMSVLQAASVVGREFTPGIVRHLTDFAADEEEMTDTALQMGILQLKKVHTLAKSIEKVYFFTHEIEREVIYDGILNRSKKLLHKKAGEYIENRYGSELEKYYELLAEHYHRAEILKKAADYYFRSALKHKETYNFESAVDYFQKFLTLCGEGRLACEDERLMAAYRELGYIHFVTADYDAALESLEKALKYSALQDDFFAIKLMIAEIHKDRGQLEQAGEIITELEPKMKEDNNSYGQWLQLKCSILRIKGDSAAVSLVRKSEKSLLKHGDYKSLSEIMKHVGIIHFSKGDIRQAMEFLKKSYRYAEKRKSLDLMANVSGDLGIIYYTTGRLTEAQEYFNKSMDLSKRISFQKGITAACINLGILYLDKGAFIKAGELFRESLAISAEVGSRLYECISILNLGDIAYEEGKFPEAEEFYIRSMELARLVDAPVEEGVDLLGLVRVYLKAGRQEECPGLLDKAYRLLYDADEQLYIADYHLYHGLLENLRGNADTARDSFNSALRIADECGNDRRKLKAMRHLADLLLRQDQGEEAQGLLEQALELARKVESDYDSAKCLYMLYRVQRSCSLEAEAQASLVRASGFISKVDPCRWTEIIQNP